MQARRGACTAGVLLVLGFVALVSVTGWLEWRSLASSPAGAAAAAWVAGGTPAAGTAPAGGGEPAALEDEAAEPFLTRPLAAASRAALREPPREEAAGRRPRDAGGLPAGGLPSRSAATAAIGRAEAPGSDGARADDATFGFFLTVFNMIPGVLRVVYQVRQFYPGSPMHLLSDGGRYDFSKVCKLPKYNCTFEVSQPANSRWNPHPWLERLWHVAKWIGTTYRDRPTPHPPMCFS
ncbi:unnamed protein product, partial [Prorocentrum cordatum]